MPLLKSDYNYQLPDSLIATHPAERRENARMMVLNRSNRTLAHRNVYDFPELLEPGSVLVINDSRVIPARLPGKRLSGAIIEALLIENVGGNQWRCKIKNSAKIKPGETLAFCNESLLANLVEKVDGGECIIDFQESSDVLKKLEQVGYAPLPPYIHKMRSDNNNREEDITRYQTVYADNYGSIAAPTAGLHFTPGLLDSIREKGVEIVSVTLHVGLGTFEPIRENDVSKHSMHEEKFEISRETAETILKAKAEKRPVVAVGTTTTRSLESAWKDGKLKTGKQSTELFIYPPYQYKVVDNLLTNFHLPESTLLMLVSALTGKDFLFNAYNEAVAGEYRFFSFGDCMYIQ